MVTQFLTQVGEKEGYIATCKLRCLRLCWLNRKRVSGMSTMQVSTPSQASLNICSDPYTQKSETKRLRVRKGGLRRHWLSWDWESGSGSVHVQVSRPSIGHSQTEEYIYMYVRSVNTHKWKKVGSKEAKLKGESLRLCWLNRWVVRPSQAGVHGLNRHWFICSLTYSIFNTQGTMVTLLLT